eukprot:6472422-Amphidinium_carterae.1
MAMLTGVVPGCSEQKCECGTCSVSAFLLERVGQTLSAQSLAVLSVPEAEGDQQLSIKLHVDCRCPKRP